MNAKRNKGLLAAAVMLLAALLQGDSQATETGHTLPTATADLVRDAQSGDRVGRLVRRAIATSPSVREATLLVESALQGITVARAGRLPQLTLGAQSTVNTAQADSLMKADGTPMAVLSAQMPLYDWGRVDAAVRGQQSAVAAARALVAQRQQEAAADALRACLELERRRGLRAAADRYVRSVAPVVDMLKNIAAADPGRAGELIQARSRSLQAEAARQSVSGRVAEAEVQLERLVGRDGIIDCSDIAPEFVQGLDLQAARAATTNVAVVVQIDEEYRQQLSAVDQISAARRPQIRVSANYGPMNQGLNLYGATVALSISMPLYDGQALQSSQQSAVERAGALLEKRQQVLRQLDYDMRAAYEQAGVQLKTANEYIELITLNEQVRRNFSTQWLAMGKRSLFELLAAEAEHYGLESSYTNAYYDAASSFAAIRGKAALLPGLEYQGTQ